MAVFLLDESVQFPDPHLAEPNGLLAVGGDLRPERLIEAYSSGIFPWYSEGDPILWFCPDPRLVIFPGKLNINRRLQKYIRQGGFEVKFDSSFKEVVEACAKTSRRGQSGTWITDDMIRAYTELHKMGYAHSVEVFVEGALAGGLYGISIGGAFFGESMFHDRTNASKIALYFLDEKITDWDFDFIDSQVPNDHMKSLGGVEVNRLDFLTMLQETLKKETKKGNWSDLA